MSVGSAVSLESGYLFEKSAHLYYNSHCVFALCISEVFCCSHNHVYEVIGQNQLDICEGESQQSSKYCDHSAGRSKKHSHQFEHSFVHIL